MSVTIRGSGQVPVQVVQTAKTDTFTGASSSFIDITGISVNITPTNSSNKVLVQVSVNATVASDNYSIAFRLMRGSTPIGVGDAAGSRLQSTFMGSQDGGGDHASCWSFSFLDSPATTSSITYKLQAASQLGANFGINVVVNDVHSSSVEYARPSSTITVSEIAYA